MLCCHMIFYYSANSVKITHDKQMTKTHKNNKVCNIIRWC